MQSRPPTVHPHRSQLLLRFNPDFNTDMTLHHPIWSQLLLLFSQDFNTDMTRDRTSRHRANVTRAMSLSRHHLDLCRPKYRSSLYSRFPWWHSSSPSVTSTGLPHPRSCAVVP